MGTARPPSLQNWRCGSGGLRKHSAKTVNRKPITVHQTRVAPVTLQVIIGGKGNGVLHIPFFQRLVELRLGKGRIRAEDHPLAMILFALDEIAALPAQTSQPHPTPTPPLSGNPYASCHRPPRM